MRVSKQFFVVINEWATRRRQKYDFYELIQNSVGFGFVSTPFFAFLHHENVFPSIAIIICVTLWLIGVVHVPMSLNSDSVHIFILCSCDYLVGFTGIKMYPDIFY